MAEPSRFVSKARGIFPQQKTRQTIAEHRALPHPGRSSRAQNMRRAAEGIQ